MSRVAMSQVSLPALTTEWIIFDLSLPPKISLQFGLTAYQSLCPHPLSNLCVLRDSAESKNSLFCLLPFLSHLHGVDALVCF